MTITEFQSLLTLLFLQNLMYSDKPNFDKRFEKSKHLQSVLK